MEGDAWKPSCSTSRSPLVCLETSFTTFLQKRRPKTPTRLHRSRSPIGLCIVGCDVAIILLYRAGWDLSVGTLVANISVSLGLAVLGVMFWQESLGPIKVIGILVCIAGLYIVNRPQKDKGIPGITELTP